VINTFLEEARKRRSADFESNEFLNRQADLADERKLKLDAEYLKKSQELTKVYEDLELPFDSDVNADLTFIQQRQLQVETRVSQLMTDIAQRKAQIAQLEANLTALRESGSGTIPAATQVESPEARAVASELQDIEAMRQELRRRLWNTQTAESERVQVKNSIDQMEKRWEAAFAKFREMQKTKTIRSPEIIRVEQDIAVRNAELKTFEAELLAVNVARQKQLQDENVRRTKIAKLTELRNEYHKIAARYEAAVTQKEERDLYKAARGKVEHIKDVTTRVELGEEPRALAKLGRRKVVLAAAFGSLAAALGIAFLLGVALDTSLQSPNEAERALGLPVLSAIPEMKRSVFR
jgi:chromosome segregation ATPase